METGKTGRISIFFFNLRLTRYDTVNRARRVDELRSGKNDKRREIRGRDFKANNVI